MKSSLVLLVIMFVLACLCGSTVFATDINETNLSFGDEMDDSISSSNSFDENLDISSNDNLKGVCPLM